VTTPNEDVLCFSFVVYGRPLVQKNNITVRNKKVGNKKIPYIGHSPEFIDYRNKMTDLLFDQFTFQGGKDPIDFPIEVHYRFYVEKKSIPDIDNLPSAFNDAIQGHKTGRKKADREKIMLTDDKLIDKIVCERFLVSDPSETRLEVDIYKKG
jgi:Holliday junction resolvase RusA-like endonuclease